jgi:hypothetical protein
VPVAFGLTFADRELGTPSLLAAALAGAGVVLAYFVSARRRFGAVPILAWAGLYAAYVVYGAAGG